MCTCPRWQLVRGVAILSDQGLRYHNRGMLESKRFGLTSCRRLGVLRSSWSVPCFGDGGTSQAIGTSAAMSRVACLMANVTL